jgi:signal transduction histidine kinase
MKYSPENETVFLSMQKKGRAAEISMSNKSVNNLSDDDISHVFDRFYRTDKSRNSETGGHGIGLSVAKAIVTAHNGKISAEYKDSVFTIRIMLPL